MNLIEPMDAMQLIGHLYIKLETITCVAVGVVGPVQTRPNRAVELAEVVDMGRGGSRGEGEESGKSSAKEQHLGS
jgi:hypothetical protein